MGTHPIFESDFDCLTENDVHPRRISLPNRRTQKWQARVRRLETVRRYRRGPRLRLAGPGDRILPVEGVWRDRVLVGGVAPRSHGFGLSQEVGLVCGEY